MNENENETTGTETGQPTVKMVGVMEEENGELKFVPYGMTGFKGGIPVYVFNDYEEYEAYAPTLPDEFLFITLDDLDTGGFKFDDKLSPDSENAVQSKTLYVISKNAEEEREILAQQAQGIYEGRNLADVFDGEISRYSDEWEWIHDRVNTGFYKGMFPADFLPLTLTDNAYMEEQIAGINCYKGMPNSSTGNHIDFISRDCYQGVARWNLTNTNNGNAQTPYPYMASNIKSWLNETLYPKLPENVKEHISGKTSLLEKRYSASGALTDSVGCGWENIGNLWIPSNFEVFGTDAFGTAATSAGQAIQYRVFAASCKNRLKGAGHNGVKIGWWLINPESGSTEKICITTSAGHPTTVIASANNYTPLCFRISE